MPNNETGQEYVGYTLKEIVIRLETKVDKVLDDHENRIRKVETNNNQRKGAVALFTSIMAFAAASAAIASVFLH